MYVMYCSSAPTTRRAISNFSWFGNDRGSRPTMRLCSRANNVCAAVSAMFSFALTSPETTTLESSDVWAAKRSIAGAVAALPRAVARGR